MQLFVDMDGVVADFERHYETVFGIPINKIADNVDWEAVRAAGDFFLRMPPMADLALLWARIEHYRPIILTGVPPAVPEAPDHKRAWVAQHIGAHVEVRCCRSSEKCHHAAPGDILIDDWEKYRDLWIAKGGVWITHRSAPETIVALDQMDALSARR